MSDIEKFMQLERFRDHLRELIAREKKRPPPAPVRIQEARMDRFQTELGLMNWAIEKLRPVVNPPKSVMERGREIHEAMAASYMQGSVDLLPYVAPEEEGVR